MNEMIDFHKARMNKKPAANFIPGRERLEATRNLQQWARGGHTQEVLCPPSLTPSSSTMGSPGLSKKLLVFNISFKQQRNRRSGVSRDVSCPSTFREKEVSLPLSAVLAGRGVRLFQASSLLLWTSEPSTALFVVPNKIQLSGLASGKLPLLPAMRMHKKPSPQGRAVSTGRVPTVAVNKNGPQGSKI